MAELHIGDPVLYVDQYGKSHFALVTAVWGKEVYQNVDEIPSVNLVFVVPDEGKKDSYGRQIARDSSVVPFKNQAAHGRYYIPLENGQPIAPLNPYNPSYWTESADK